MKVLERLETVAEKPRRWVKPVLVVSVAAILVMWVYIFLLAPTNNAGKIGDSAWTTAAQARCTLADGRIAALPLVNPADTSPAGLRSRADSVEQGNAIIASMLTDLGATEPSTQIGRTIVTKWLADWHTYLGDRVNYVAGLRAGTVKQFGESQIENAPISDFIGSIATQNNMDSCSVLPLS